MKSTFTSVPPSENDTPSSLLKNAVPLQLYLRELV
jgi:hypothetical protein